MSDVRPKWEFTEMTEVEFRKVRAEMIVSITARWKFTGEDTSAEWLEATTRLGKTIVLPPSWEAAFKPVWKSHSPGLLDVNYLGERMQKRCEEIDKWEKANNKDRAEYERLKKKFS